MIFRLKAGENDILKNINLVVQALIHIPEFESYIVENIMNNKDGNKFINKFTRIIINGDDEKNMDEIKDEIIDNNLNTVIINFITKFNEYNYINNKIIEHNKINDEMNITNENNKNIIIVDNGKAYKHLNINNEIAYELVSFIKDNACYSKINFKWYSFKNEEVNQIRDINDILVNNVNVSIYRKVI